MPTPYMGWVTWVGSVLMTFWVGLESLVGWIGLGWNKWIDVQP